MRTPWTDILRRGKETGGGRAPFLVGLIAIVFTLVFAYFAYTKDNPFSGPFELNAVVEQANELKARSPVRIAGVNVGKVKSVEPLEDGSGHARIKMEIEERGLPIKRDAELKIRSRIFLEGNYFVDLKPGSPSAKPVESGHTLPPSQASAPVQFGQVLTALQSDTREDLQTFLDEYSKSLEGPGARGLNQAIDHWEEAYRNTALAGRAYLGKDEHDLHKVLKGQGRVFGALSRDTKALEELVRDLNLTFSGFAREEGNLRATIPVLRDVLRVGRPALASLNEGLPSMRAFAREALPAARSSSPTLDVQIPFIKQARALVSDEELGGLTDDLRETVPALVRLNEGTTLQLQQNRALASCQNNVLLPFAKTPIPDPDFPGNSGEPWFEQAQRAFVGLSGESRIADANSSMFRIQGGGGPTTLASTGEQGEQLYGQSLYPIDGVRPAAPASDPVFRPGEPCENQEVPDLNARSGKAESTANPQPVATAENRARAREVATEWKKLVVHMQRVAKGEPSVDPLAYSDLGERMQARKLGLRVVKDDRYLVEVEK